MDYAWKSTIRDMDSIWNLKQISSSRIHQKDIPHEFRRISLRLTWFSVWNLYRLQKFSSVNPGGKRMYFLDYDVTIGIFYGSSIHKSYLFHTENFYFPYRFRRVYLHGTPSGSLYKYHPRFHTQVPHGFHRFHQYKF